MFSNVICIKRKSNGIRVAATHVPVFRSVAISHCMTFVINFLRVTIVAAQLLVIPLD